MRQLKQGNTSRFYHFTLMQSASFFRQNDLNGEGSLGNRSRESLKEKMSICNSESIHGPPGLTSPVSIASLNNQEIPKILVHSLGRGETVETTVSADIPSIALEK